MANGIIGGGDRGFHIDRNVPVALIVTILVAFLGQTAAGIWWASSISQRVSNLEIVQAARAPNSERLVRVETRLQSIENNTLEIQQDVKRLLRGIGN